MVSVSQGWRNLILVANCLRGVARVWWSIVSLRILLRLQFVDIDVRKLQLLSYFWNVWWRASSIRVFRVRKYLIIFLTYLWFLLASKINFNSVVTIKVALNVLSLTITVINVLIVHLLEYILLQNGLRWADMVASVLPILESELR